VTVAPKPSPGDVADLAFGKLDLELTSNRIVAGQPGLDFGAPYLCATFSVTNVGTNDGSVDVTQFGAVTPDGQIKATSAAGMFADGSGKSGGVSLAPGATATVDVCFDTDGKTGAFTIEHHPGGVARDSWTVQV